MQQRNKVRLNNKALTFIEVIIAILILAIMTGAMLGVFLMARMSVYKANHHMMAINLAMQKMEEIKNTAYSSLADGETTEEDLTLDMGIGESAQPLLCDRTTAISDFDIPGSGEEETLTIGKQVSVTVSWSDRSFGGVNNVSETVTTVIIEE